MATKVPDASWALTVHTASAGAVNPLPQDCPTNASAAAVGEGWPWKSELRSRIMLAVEPGQVSVVRAAGTDSVLCR